MEVVKTHASKAVRNAEIVKAHVVEGKTYRELAAAYEISNASVGRILNKAEVRDVLDTALNHLVSFAPVVVRNYRRLLDSKNEGIVLKATEALAKILGVSPTHTPSNVNIMFNQSNTTIISNQMREIIDGISGNRDFIDAEFTAILAD